MTETDKTFLRLVLSITAAAALTGALWTLVPDQLSISTDAVSSLIFGHLDLVRYDYGYYFIAFLFPLIAMGLYWLLAWKGPLRYGGGERPALLPLTTDLELGIGEATPLLEGPSAAVTSARPDPSGPTGVAMETSSHEGAAGITVIGTIWATARIALPMATIVDRKSVV